MFNYSNSKVNNLYDELIKIYRSFGYNNFEVFIRPEYYENNNTVDVYLEFNEGNLTKIKKINIFGNNNYDKKEVFFINMVSLQL